MCQHMTVVNTYGMIPQVSDSTWSGHSYDYVAAWNRREEQDAEVWDDLWSKFGGLANA